MKPWKKAVASTALAIIALFASFIIAWGVPRDSFDLFDAICFPFARLAMFASTQWILIFILLQIILYSVLFARAWIQGRTVVGVRKIVILHGVAASIAILAATYCFVRDKPNVEAIKQRYTLWQAALRENRFSDAYSIMTPDYRAATEVSNFVEQFKIFNGDNNILQAHPCATIKGGRATLYPFDSHWFELWSGPNYHWTKIGKEWFLTGKYDMYLD